MKVAVCLSGQPRYIKITQEYLQKNLLDLYDCDTFLHAWFDPKTEFDGSGWVGSYMPDDDTREALLDLYKPKSYLIVPPMNEKFIEESVHIIKNTDAKPYIQKSMFYSMCEANRLKSDYEAENEFNYDCVVRIRFDAALMSNLLFPKVTERHMYYTDVIRKKDVPCDWCFVATSTTMDKICTIYDMLDSYATSGHIKFCGENLLRHHLHMNGIQSHPIRVSNMLARDSELKNRNFGFIY